MLEMRAVASVLRTFPGSRVVTGPDAASPPLRVRPGQQSRPMHPFISYCDYCAEWTTVKWVFDREQNEDRVACDPCRANRAFDVTPTRRLAQ